MKRTRYVHEPDRPASRAGTVRSEVVLGGRKVAIQRPRVRTAAGEVPLPTFQTMAHRDPLDRRVVEQMLVGVATRQYARSLDALPADVPSRGTSKSAVSRRFVAKTQAAQLTAWQAQPPDDLALPVLRLDGVHVGKHCLIVVLGVTEDGTKPAIMFLAPSERLRVRGKDCVLLRSPFQAIASLNSFLPRLADTGRNRKELT